MVRREQLVKSFGIPADLETSQKATGTGTTRRGLLSSILTLTTKPAVMTCTNLISTLR